MQQHINYVDCLIAYYSRVFFVVEVEGNNKGTVQIKEKSILN